MTVDFSTDPVGMRALPPLGDCGWVDLHNHLLPALDDGPDDWASSIALCRMLVADGVTHAAATPHMFGPYCEQGRMSTVLRRTAELASRLAEANIPLEIYQGADVRIDSQWEKELPEGGVLALGRGGNYILVEPPHDVWIPAPRVCDLLESSAYRGVLTHPERHPRIKRGGAVLLQEWVDRDVIIQVTAGSLLGDYGSTAERIAWDIIESPIAAIVASDAHDLVKRPPRMAAAAALIHQRLGQQHVMRLCRDTPWSLIFDTVPASANCRIKRTPVRMSRERAGA
ncbi:MAG: CpsB/CapC family capsule biosynthesis tyrosine phosphatase [Planctomycetota bacterium]